MLNEYPRLYTAPESVTRKGIAEQGERVRAQQWAVPGDRVRVFIRYGRLFGGSVIEGVVRDVTGPASRFDPSGRPLLGVPIRDAACTVYALDEYRIDGIGRQNDGRGGVRSGADVTSGDGRITLDTTEILFLESADA